MHGDDAAAGVLAAQREDARLGIHDAPLPPAELVMCRRSRSTPAPRDDHAGPSVPDARRPRCSSRGTATPGPRAPSGTADARSRCDYDEVDDHADPAHPRLVLELDEVTERAEARVDPVEVEDVIAVVAVRRRVERE